MGVARIADFVCASLAVTFVVGCTTIPVGREPEPSPASADRAMTFTKLSFAREAWQDPPLVGGEIVDLYLDHDLLVAVTRAAEVHATGLDGIPRWISTAMTERPRYRAASNGNALVFISGVDMVSLDRENGKMLRKSRLAFAPSATPAASESTLYVASFTDQKIHTVSLRDGAPGWTFRTMATVSSALVLGGLYPRQILYFAGEDGMVGALEALDAESLTPSNPAWQRRTHGRVSADLTLSGNILLVPSEDETLYALDRVTGEVRWTYPAGVALTQAPVATVDTVFQPTPNGVVALGAADGLEKYLVTGANRFLIQWGKRALFLQGENTVVVANADTGAVQMRVRYPRAKFFVTNPDGRQLIIADNSGRLYALEEEHAMPERRPTP